jgi:DNA-binding LacI/PurR family transcriptional regulator
MADVARVAGVSVSTVSYALTGARPISQATRERIERAMLDLGYTPNAFARGLKSKRSKIIALLFPRRGLDLGLGSLEYILGASDHAQDRGYHLLLWTTDAEAPNDLARLAGQGLVDGALLMEVRLQDPRIDVLRKAGLPFAMIGRTEDSTGIDVIDTDFDQCARTAVEYLISQGHRRFGFVNQASAVLESGRANAVRLDAGVLAAARAAQVELIAVTCESSIAGGRAAFRRLVEQDADVSAVIAFNEQAAPGIMAAAVEFGWRVPEDFSIVSVDMPAQAAQMTAPPMTTVGPSAAGMGRAAVDALIRRLEGNVIPAGQVLFDGELQLRGTSGPIRRPPSAGVSPQGR